MCKSIIILFIATFSFSAFAQNEEYSSECYRDHLSDDGKHVSKVSIEPIAERERLVVSTQYLRWNQNDFELVHRVCRERGNCLFATGVTFRKDPDAEGGWNEAHISSVTCENDLSRGGRRWRDSYNIMLSEERIAAFLTPAQQERADQMNRAAEALRPDPIPVDPNGSNSVDGSD